jgi:hypothetical protein
MRESSLSDKLIIPNFLQAVAPVCTLTDVGFSKKSSKGKIVIMGWQFGENSAYLKGEQTFYFAPASGIHF